MQFKRDEFNARGATLRNANMLAASSSNQVYCSWERNIDLTFRRFLKSDSGATAIEYGLIAALVAIAKIGASTTMGTKLKSNFGNVSGQMK